MIEKATHVTIFWNLARNPEKNSSKIHQGALRRVEVISRRSGRKSVATSSAAFKRTGRELVRRRNLIAYGVSYWSEFLCVNFSIRLSFSSSDFDPCLLSSVTYLRNLCYSDTVSPPFPIRPRQEGKQIWPDLDFAARQKLTSCSSRARLMPDFATWLPN